MTDTVTYLSLVIGAIGSLFAIVMAWRSLVKSWRNKAVEEAENTRALRDNTDAIHKLVEQWPVLEGRVAYLERKIND